MPLNAPTRLLALLVSLLVHAACTLPRTDAPHAPFNLSDIDRQAGWTDLLAQGLPGWRGSRANSDDDALIGPGWSFADGTLHLQAGGQGGDLVSPGLYENFELRFEWKVAPGANSGVKVRVPQLTPGQAARGPEYQVLDDALHPNGRTPNTSASALYDLASPQDKPVALAGEFQRGRIVANGPLLEHWLNDVRVVSVQLGTPEWDTAHRASKFADLPRFGFGPGHIVLQDHDNEVWFRNVHVRNLDTLPGEMVQLDLGPELSGWSRIGDARYTCDGSTITGEVTGGQQSFLTTQGNFGDFLLDVDVKLDVLGNSGIQIRSTVDPTNNTLSGYQIEIDPSERSWSGGLYDERRRGWLDDLSDTPLARAAFDLTGWNHYHIEAIGPSLRSWVNGVPAADHLDGMTLAGVLGLQVHSGQAGKIRWRNLNLRHLGQHRWVPHAVTPNVLSGDGGHDLPYAVGPEITSLRLTYTGTGILRAHLHPFDEVLDVGNSETPDEPGSKHVLELHAVGSRLAIVLDGKTLMDRTTPRGTGSAGADLRIELSEDDALRVISAETLTSLPAD